MTITNLVKAVLPRQEASSIRTTFEQILKCKLLSIFQLSPQVKGQGILRSNRIRKPIDQRGAGRETLNVHRQWQYEAISDTP